MIAACPNRRRLEEMVQFAAAYRGWTTRQLADALQRDPRSIIPERGMPKVDLVVRLADALDWPVGDLLEHLWEPGPSVGVATTDDTMARDEVDFESDRRFCFADDAERLADLRNFLRDGDLDAAIELADDLSVVAMSPTDRRDAALLLADALERRGRPMRCLAALQRASRITTADVGGRLVVLARLADAYHRTGQPTEAAAIAAEVLALAKCGAPAQSVPHSASTLAIARAHAVRGACIRDTVLESGGPIDAALEARRHLDDAAAAIGGLGRRDDQDDQDDQDDLDDSEVAGLALIVDAGRMAMDVYAGRRCINDALHETLTLVDEAIEPDRVRDRRRLAGIGWWCVLAGAVAMGRLDDARLHRTLAILTNKADELAGAVDCWALRERILTLEHGRRHHLAALAGHDEPWLLDRDDLRMVIGCMGASRRFRPIGTRILRSAVVVEDPPV